MKICSAMIGIKFTFRLVHRMSLLLLQHPEPPTAYNRLFSLLVTSFLRAELRDCKSEQSQLLFLSTTVVFTKQSSLYSAPAVSFRATVLALTSLKCTISLLYYRSLSASEPVL